MILQFVNVFYFVHFRHQDNTPMFFIFYLCLARIKSVKLCPENYAIFHFIAVKSPNHGNVTNITGKQFIIVLYSHSVIKFIQTIYLCSAPVICGLLASRR